jgi:hypothetical protein
MKIRRSELFIILFFFLSASLFFQCENKDRYYRPDEPEQICVIGIIDIDDTIYYDTFAPWIHHDSVEFARTLYFEKSFQSEYSDNPDNSFRDLSFSISTSNEDLVTGHGNASERRAQFRIPDEIKFESGKKYFLHAKDEQAAGIIAECTVPDLPPSITITGIKTEIVMLNYPDNNCYTNYIENNNKYPRRTAEISFSFSNQEPESYYAILLSGSYSDSPVDWSPGWGTNLFNFTVTETNTEGFFYYLKGRKTAQDYCKEYTLIDESGCEQTGYYRDSIAFEKVNAYFIDGSKIPGSNCFITLNTSWDWTRTPPDFIKCFRIRIMSIPKELYLFQKSLLTYSRVSGDPFSEPVNLKGNIINGNGIFALCRSRDFIVYTGQQGGPFDPWF